MISRISSCGGLVIVELIMSYAIMQLTTNIYEVLKRGGASRASIKGERTYLQLSCFLL